MHVQFFIYISIDFLTTFSLCIRAIRIYIKSIDYIVERWCVVDHTSTNCNNFWTGALNTLKPHICSLAVFWSNSIVLHTLSHNRRALYYSTQEICSLYLCPYRIMSCGEWITHFNSSVGSFIRFGSITTTRLYEYTAYDVRLCYFHF